MRVELVYDSDCPNVAATRANLLRAFGDVGLPAKWSEWERSATDTPEHVCQFGSPAVLVNGHDVAGLAPNAAPNCRIYRTDSGVPSGVPSIEVIVSAFKAAQRAPFTSAAFKRRLPIIPAVTLALLPTVACPACWPAYAAVLSSLGLGFLANATYLLPLTTTFLVIVLIGLGYRASQRRGYWPLLTGLLAAAFIIVGKFRVASDSLFYSGLIALVGASFWNTWPRNQSKPAPCCESIPLTTPEDS